MKKQPSITDKTRMKLMNAFWQLYRAKPIHKITVRAICDLAGYNRSTFYEYFLDVHDVLEQLENALINELEQFPINLHLGNDPVNKYDLTIVSDLLNEYRDYFSVLLGVNGDPAFQIKLKNTIKPKIIHLLFNDSSVDALELNLALEYHISAMIGVLHYWAESSNSISAHEFIHLLFKLTSIIEIQKVYNSF